MRGKQLEVRVRLQTQPKLEDVFSYCCRLISSNRISMVPCAAVVATSRIRARSV